MTNKEAAKILKSAQTDRYIGNPEPLIDAWNMAIKALEQEPTNTIDYHRAFKIACDLLSGGILFGVDTDKIFELMMQKDGIVSNSSYEEYILTHMQELDQGQYASSSEKSNKSEISTGSIAKNDLAVDCISRNTVLTLINDVKNANGFSDYSQYEYLFDQVDKMPPVTPQQKYEDIAKAFQIGLLFGFGEKQDNIDRIIDEIKLVASARKKCRNINSDYAECDQFVCSNCGIELQDWHRVERDVEDGDITYCEYEFNYCPNCGAEMESKE